MRFNYFCLFVTSNIYYTKRRNYSSKYNVQRILQNFLWIVFSNNPESGRGEIIAWKNFKTKRKEKNFLSSSLKPPKSTSQVGFHGNLGAKNLLNVRWTCIQQQIRFLSLYCKYSQKHMTHSLFVYIYVERKLTIDMFPLSSYCPYFFKFWGIGITVQTGKKVNASFVILTRILKKPTRRTGIVSRFRFSVAVVMAYWPWLTTL